MDLAAFFKDNNKAAIAFSGGVDSSYLLYEAVRLGADVTAYYVKSQFQPGFEYEDALRLAGFAGARMKVIPLSVLQFPEVTANPANRCYYCKRQIFGNIIKAAAADGYRLILDGTNASDQVADRPGMKALRELEVRSPLRECGLTKQEIRRLSREAGLFTWDKPSYACLATRIPTGVTITEDMLEATERGEAALSELGFKDFRIRMNLGNPAEGLIVLYDAGNAADGHIRRIARLQILEGQSGLLDKRKAEVIALLKADYDIIALDPHYREPSTD